MRSLYFFYIVVIVRIKKIFTPNYLFDNVLGNKMDLSSNKAEIQIITKGIEGLRIVDPCDKSVAIAPAK